MSVVVVEHEVWSKLPLPKQAISFELDRQIEIRKSKSIIEAVGPELVMSYVAAQMGGECRIDIGNLHGATVASEAGDRWDKGKRVPFGDGAAEYRVIIESECAFIAGQARPCPLPRVHPSKDTLPCAHVHTAK